MRDALPHSFSGKIVSHDKKGREIGYPTANMKAPDDAPEGVFAGTVTRDNNKHKAMIFVGRPITVGSSVRRAEAHILDFPDQDLYGEHHSFTLLLKIRDNKMFDPIDSLITAIDTDESRIREYFKKHPMR